MRAHHIMLALALAGAGCLDQGDDYPVHPETAQVPGGTAPPTATMITGRACFISDARSLASCGGAGAAKLAVTLGTTTTTTNGDGTFTLPASALAGGETTIGISGGGIVPTTASIGNPLVVPVVDANVFDQMLADNGIVLEPGSGSIIGAVTRGDGTTGESVTAQSTPSPAFGPLYDGSTPTAWTLNGTGAAGVIWIPGAPAGTNVVTLSDGTGGETTVGGVQVVDGGLTIVEAVLP